jgi:hypothetical protein
VASDREGEQDPRQLKELWWWLEDLFEEKREENLKPGQKYKEQKM